MRIIIDVPSKTLELWERTLVHFENRDQSKIDALTVQVADLTSRLKQSNSALQLTAKT